MNRFEDINPSPEHIIPRAEKEPRPSQPELNENLSNIQEQPPTCDSYQKTPKELEQIEEIRQQIQEGVKLAPPQQEKSVPKNFTITVTEVIGGQQYYVQYVPKDEIYPAYGYSDGNNVGIRQDLPPRVKMFVRAHELYHSQDKATWGGWLGREIRANVIPGLKDPIGLAATVWKTITDVDRIKFYLRRIKEGH